MYTMFRSFVFVLVVFLLLCNPFVQCTETDETVSLPNGNRLKGISLMAFHSKRSYLEFRGIPYAKPPVGEFRFKPTQLFDSTWGPEPKDASEYGNMCPQLDPFYDPDVVEGGSYDELKVLGDENCLTVNVATPNIQPEILLPVFIWFHGGNFQTESGQEYGPAKLMDHDMVVVTFNHRIGPLGFLNTEDDNIHGNMGLKDQTILLKWVKENIRSFGGDAESITVGGTNAGAVSVHLHLLSELSKGLFHRAIIQSGTAISPWVLMRDSKEKVKKMAKSLKCGNDTDVLRCITKADAVSIVRTLPRMAEWYIDPLVPFGPSIELFGKADEKFLSRNPYSVLADGNYWAKDIPVIMGVNSHEGLLHAMDIGHQVMLRRVFNLEWLGAAPISLHYKLTSISPQSVSEAVRNFYYPISEEEKAQLKLVDKDFLFENLTNMYSDRHFFIPLHHSAKIMGKHNQLYLYWFDYVSDQSIHGLYGYESSQIPGPSHYDQLQYIFVTSYFNETKGEDNIKFEKYFLRGLYKFVKNGSPFNNDWIQITKEMMEGSVPLLYNRIGKLSDAPNLIEKFTDRVVFWNGQFLMEYDRGSIVDQMMGMGDLSSTLTTKDEL